MADARIDGTVKAVFYTAVALAVFTTLKDDATLGWIVAGPILLMLLWVISRVPLRHSLMGLMFISMVLENPTEAPAAGLWKSPLYQLGPIMLNHLNQTTQVSWMVFSGSDLLLGFMIFLARQRRATRSTMDGIKRTPVPRILIQLAFLSLFGTLFVFVRGVWLGGGDQQKSLWQVEKVIYLPIYFLLFQAALRNVEDYLALGRVLLTAAFLRALLALYVVYFAGLEYPPPWATTHHDSMLFACAIVIIVSFLMHKAVKGGGRLALYLVPILVWGMVVNNRRTVWVQIILVFVTLYFSTPTNPLKKKIKRWALYTSPAWLAYIAVGWRSGSAIFKPVQTIRSVVEPANDVSTMTRDIENYCVAKTIGSAPIFGLGYGHIWFQYVALPPMPYPLEPWLPHNSLLGLWFASGFFGYTCMTLLWTAGVYFGVRAYRHATSKSDRTVALVSFGSVLIYLIQCYADLGLGAPTGAFMVAASIAMAGQLAVSTGAFPVNAAGRYQPQSPANQPLPANGR